MRSLFAGGAGEASYPKQKKFLGSRQTRMRPLGRLLTRSTIACHNRFTLGSGISSQATPVPAIAVGTMRLSQTFMAQLLKLHHHQSTEL